MPGIFGDRFLWLLLWPVVAVVIATGAISLWAFHGLKQEHYAGVMAEQESLFFPKQSLEIVDRVLDVQGHILLIFQEAKSGDLDDGLLYWHHSRVVDELADLAQSVQELLGKMELFASHEETAQLQNIFESYRSNMIRATDIVIIDPSMARGYLDQAHTLFDQFLKQANHISLRNIDHAKQTHLASILVFEQTHTRLSILAGVSVVLVALLAMLASRRIVRQISHLASGLESLVRSPQNPPALPQVEQMQAKGEGDFGQIANAVILFRKSLIERTKAEKQTAIALEQLKEAEAIAGLGRWQYGLKSDQLEWSKQAYRIYGIEPGTPIAPRMKSLVRRIHPDDRVALVATRRAAKSWRGLYDFEYRILLGDDVRWVRERADLGRAKNDIIIGTVIDTTLQHQHEETLQTFNKALKKQVAKEITHRQESERTMIAQSRVAAMGEMLSAIAHHWRQPLSAISLLAQGLEDAYAFDELDQALLGKTSQKIKTIAQELSGTINSLQAFHAASEPKDMSPVQEVETVVSLLKPQLSMAQIAIHTHYGETLQPSVQIKIDGASLRQVLFNLIINARDAILSSGHAQGWIKIRLFREKKRLHLSVEDSGGGVEPGNLGRVFEPFFTTKERGRGVGVITGVGLGLYVSKQIVEEQLEGVITAQNAREGAFFSLWLPIG